MNSNTQKLVAYMALAVVCAILMATWGIFSFFGKTDVASFIAEVKDLIGIIIALGMALGGFHAAVGSNGAAASALPPVINIAPAASAAPASTVVVRE